MKVLDLDMDYFMTEIARTPESCEERLSEEEWGNSVWDSDAVRQFLEQNLGLSRECKIPGRIVCGHNEALFFWEELISNGKLSDPFDVIHVDSHADLGLGYESWIFLQNEFLKLPIEVRRKIRSYDKSDNTTKKIGIGDYLLWGIAYKMISSIIYCANPAGDKNDYLWQTLKDFHEEPISNKPVKIYIQLKYNDSMEGLTGYFTNDDKNKYLEGAIKDPEVEMLIIPTIEAVRFNGDFDYAILAQSPSYTPESADFIMDIFREYIKEI